MRTSRLFNVLVGAVVLATAACSSGSDDDGKDTTSTSASEAPNQNPVGIPAQARSLEPVAEGKLTACVDIQNTPFSFEQDGRTTGLDPELLRALGGRLGLQAEFHVTSADDLFDDLDTGKCDVVASAVSKADAGATARTMSEPYYDVRQALLVRKGDEAAYPDLAHLRGRSVGVQPGTPGAAVARTEAGVNVVELPDFARAVTALLDGRVDGVVHDLPLVSASAEASEKTVVTQRFEAVTDQYVFVMAKGADEMKRTIDEALKAVRRDDSYNSLVRRFFGPGAVS